MPPVCTQVTAAYHLVRLLVKPGWTADVIRAQNIIMSSLKPFSSFSFQLARNKLFLRDSCLFLSLPLSQSLSLSVCVYVFCLFCSALTIITDMVDWVSVNINLLTCCFVKVTCCSAVWFLLDAFADYELVVCY